MDVFSALKEIEEFKNLDDTHLQWLASKGKVTQFQDGDKIVEIGQPVNELRIVLAGEVKFRRVQAGNVRYLGTVEKGEITGLLPYSRMKVAGAESIASGDVTVFNLDRTHFPEMISQHHELTEVLVHIMTDRVRDFTSMQQQNDKMMALGKLSAGLAHELNNPSAAVVRSARELRKHLANLPAKFKRVIKIKSTEAIIDDLNKLVFAKIAAEQQTLTLLEKNQLEDELTTWLEANGIENAYEFAENFVAFNLTQADLNHLKAILREEDLAPVVDWVAQVLTSEALVKEIEEASKRINTLVCSIKSYTHMDHAPEKELADVILGISNTLTMLNHKIKKTQVKLIENIAEGLPFANIFVSSLNQVWTNLIDNALDALEGTPGATLEIKASKEREFIRVDIIDNGPGIATDIQDKIFDSFFTTKPVGKGTGLGLEVVRQIVMQHKGKVSMKSIPGRTAFTVCLPIE